MYPNFTWVIEKNCKTYTLAIFRSKDRVVILNNILKFRYNSLTECTDGCTDEHIYMQTDEQELIRTLLMLFANVENEYLIRS